MGQVKKFIFCAVFCLFFPAALFGEGILLKSGQKIEGKILERTDEYVKLEFQGAQLVYYNDEIASVEQAGASGQNPVNPEMESLYEAYTATLKAPQKAQPETVSAREQKVQSDQVAGTVNESLPDLSQLTSQYQEMIQAALSATQGARSGTGGGLPQLPPEYQQVLKEVSGGLKNADLGFPEQE